MFKITPIQTKEKQKEYAQLCGVEFKDNCFAYAMLDYDTDSLMAIAQFEICEGGGYISDIRSTDGLNDFEAMFILGRATMNFIDTCGVHSCKANLNAGEERLLKAIGFKRNENEYYCDMTGLFDGHCSGEKVNIEN